MVNVVSSGFFLQNDPERRLTAREAFLLNINSPNVVERYYAECLKYHCTQLLTNTHVPIDDCSIMENDWELSVKESIRLASHVCEGKIPLWGVLESSNKVPETWTYNEFQSRKEFYEKALASFLSSGISNILLSGFYSLVETRAAINACLDHNIRFSISIDGTATRDRQTTPIVELSCFGPTFDPFRPLFLILELDNFDQSALTMARIFAQSCRTDVGLFEYNHASKPLTEDQISIIKQMGISLVGSNTPQNLRTIHQKFLDKKSTVTDTKRCVTVCSWKRTITIGAHHPVCIIGERINPTGKKKLSKNLREGNWDYLIKVGQNQEQAGAHCIDVNVGMSGIDETVVLPEVVQQLNVHIESPLCIDSNNMEAMTRAALIYHGRPLLNSTTAEPEKLSTMFNCVQRTGGVFVLMTIDENGIPKDTNSRIAIARSVLEQAQKIGLSPEAILVDCLTLSAATEQEQVMATLEAIRIIKKELGMGTILGVSNISFGLPFRKVINHTFLCMALEAGLDCAIIDPRIQELHHAVSAAAVLTDRDSGAQRFIAKYGNLEKTEQNLQEQKQISEDSVTSRLMAAIQNGNKEATVELTQLLHSTNPSTQAILDQALIPGIQKVGDLFEQGLIFLPQLMKAAECVQVSFAVLGLTLDQDNEAISSKPSIMLATVYGDIHDLGKNLVATFFSSNGYHVIDLGKNVDPGIILREVTSKRPDIIGLSALMTTTMPYMENTVKLLKETIPSIPVIVGGAVVTNEFALSIGADGFASNAAKAVNIANAILQKSR